MGGEDVSDEVGFEVGEVVERVTVARLGEVNEPDKAAGADEDVFEIQVAVDRGLRADNRFVEERGEAGQRVGQAQAVKARDQFAEERLAHGDDAPRRLIVGRRGR